MVSRSSWHRVLLVLLPSERASFCKPCFSSCRLAEDSRAANTQDYCLCMAKDGGDFIASWAVYIHEIGIGALHQALLLVFPLLLFWRGMKKILCERLVLMRRSSPPEKAVSFFKCLNFLFLWSLFWYEMWIPIFFQLVTHLSNIIYCHLYFPQ